MGEYLQRLILYLADELEPGEKRELEEQLERDERLRSELKELSEAIKLTRRGLPPEPGQKYFSSFWQRLRPRLEHRSRWQRLTDLFRPHQGLRLAGAIGAMAAAFIAAILILYQLTVPKLEQPRITQTVVRIPRKAGFFDRVAAAHLERSRLLLRDLVNISIEEEPQLERILDDRQRGERLLSDNRTLRAAALKQDNERLAALLEELELVLMDIANLDPELAIEALRSLQRRIERRDLLTRIDVSHSNGESQAASPNKEV